MNLLKYKNSTVNYSLPLEAHFIKEKYKYMEKNIGQSYLISRLIDSEMSAPISQPKNPISNIRRVGQFDPIKKDEVYSTWRDKERLLYKRRVRYHKRVKMRKPIDGDQYKFAPGYHMDHKVSVVDGFNNFIPYSWIRHHSNCQIVHESENLCKGVNSPIDDFNALIERVKDTRISRF